MNGNPCEGCAVNCCHQMGMFLSKDELSRLFKDYSDDVTVKQSGKVFLIWPKEGRVCPHLQDGRCEIHRERPIDCRIYPYQLKYAIERRHTVKIVSHQAGVPAKE